MVAVETCKNVTALIITAVNPGAVKRALNAAPNITNKKCCEVDGEYSCCDSDVDLEEPVKVDAGVEYMSLVPFANLSYPANESKQRMKRGNIYCGDFEKNCGDHCCGMTDVCCGDGCCGITDTCCGGNHCCKITDSCCGSGCCLILQTCRDNVCY
ncbi:unnamed protein product [Larinioides sclopetarius]|uniref:Uncharacterized protein n=1 Tax=Larinioides sclopetarius TaxID=280406 RepID=A0AAV2B4I4_9ARAC